MNIKNPPIYLFLSLSILSFSLAGCKSATATATATHETLYVGISTQEFAFPPLTPADVMPTDEPAQALPGESGQEAGIYEGDPVGFTSEGFPYRGDPHAPLTVEEYSDYLCPFCGRHFSQTLPSLLEQYVAEGKLKYVFRDMPLVSLHPNAPAGHAAALCVGEQGATLYWQMHAELFASQSQWGSLADPSSFLAGLASRVGADMSAYGACLASGRMAAQVDQSILAGQELGFTGTPSFRFIRTQDGNTNILVGAYPLETFTEWIDALLAGEEPPQSAQEEEQPAELPYWANQQGLQPDPSRPGYTMAGDQYKGNPQATVVVVEFSDFQCPACQQHTLQVQPSLDQALVETGKVMWVFKHLPLRIHPQALVAAAAAECAADQGQFWEMHDLLFEEQSTWVQEDAEPALLEIARGLGLDVQAFSRCLDSREPLERVFRDYYDGQGIVDSTPTFVILSGGRGSLLTGSREPQQFISILQGVIDQASGEP